MNNKKKQWIVLGIILFFLVFFGTQFSKLFSSHIKNGPSVIVLHEVMGFQLEWLDHLFLQALQIDHTGELNTLQQAIYIVDFTQRKLDRVSDSNIALELKSFTWLMQLIVSLQMTGERLVTEDEMKLLKQSYEAIHQLKQLYPTLLNSKGEFVPSTVASIIKLDEQLQHTIQESIR